MALNSAAVAALEEAIAAGVRVVRYGDRTVEYPSMSEMLAALAQARRDAAVTAGTVISCAYAQFSPE